MPVALASPEQVDATVSAQRLLERVQESVEVELPPPVSGPSWVGLLPPRGGWEERMRGDVANVRAAVDTAKHFFRERAEGVSDRQAARTDRTGRLGAHLPRRGARCARHTPPSRSA